MTPVGFDWLGDVGSRVDRQVAAGITRSDSFVVQELQQQGIEPLVALFWRMEKQVCLRISIGYPSERRPAKRTQREDCRSLFSALRLVFFPLVIFQEFA
jgi:hypothetical protein